MEKKLSFVGALFCLILVSSILGAEILVRIFVKDASLHYGYFPEFPYIFDSYVGIRHKPNRTFEWREPEFDSFFQTNSIGFRASEEFVKGQCDNLVVAIIGDSFVQAIQVEEKNTFSEILQARLGERTLKGHSLEDYYRERACNVQVQNYGVSGLGLVHYLQMYRYYVRSHKPDVVLVCIFTNDFRNSSSILEATGYLKPEYKRRKGVITDILPFTESTCEGGLYADIKEFEIGMKITKFLTGHSALFRFITKEKLKRKLMYEAFPIDEYIFEEPRQKVWEDAWESGLWCMKELIKECKEDKAIPIIVLVPGLYEIDSGIWELMEKAYRRAGGHNKLARDKVRKELRRECEELGAHYIDLTEAFREVWSKGILPCYKEDIHWNEMGHRLAEKITEDYLIKEIKVIYRQQDY